MPADPWVDDKALAIQMLLDEVAICRGLDHINIARVFESFVDREKKSVDDDGNEVELPEVSFVMQVCSGGALTKLLAREKPLSEHEVATLSHKMLSAIHYCHQHGVVHRDIKVTCTRLRSWQLSMESCVKQSLICCRPLFEAGRTERGWCKSCSG